MPNIQISQIVLRSGPAIDLPGAPTSLNPLVYAPGLLAGEMAFMTDSARIYIGHEPTQGQANYNRLTFPYRNIEVLTENSIDALQKIVGQTSKEEAEFAYHLALLPIHTTDWENVILPRPGDETYAYRLAFSDSVAATIDYTAYGADLKPVKIGTMTLRYFAGEAEPSLVDESATMRKTGLLNPEVHQAAAMYQQVDFKFEVAGPNNARYLLFKYKNRSNSVLSLRFKVSRPKV